MKKLTLFVSLLALALVGCRTAAPTAPSTLDAETERRYEALWDVEAARWKQCAIRLEEMADPVGFGREWYRVVFVGPEPAGQVPSFTIDPKDTWMEQWTEEPLAPGPGFLAWFSGPGGTYTLTARVPCGASATVIVVLPGKPR